MEKMDRKASLVVNKPRDLYYKDSDGEFHYWGSEDTMDRSILREGLYVLDVKPSSVRTSTIPKESQKFAELLAVTKSVSDELSEVIWELSQFHSSKPSEMTPKEVEAWDKAMQYFESFGFSRPRMTWARSTLEIVDALLDIIVHKTITSSIKEMEEENENGREG